VERTDVLKPKSRSSMPVDLNLLNGESRTSLPVKLTYTGITGQYRSNIEAVHHPTASRPFVPPVHGTTDLRLSWTRPSGSRQRNELGYSIISHPPHVRFVQTLSSTAFSTHGQLKKPKQVRCSYIHYRTLQATTKGSPESNKRLILKKIMLSRF